MTRGGFSSSGPMGYQNKLILNGHLKAGNNEIKVVFESSSILENAREEGHEKQLIRDMYAHAVITRGRLNDSSFGIESYDLDQLILSPDIKAEVLENKLLRRFTEDKLSHEVSVVYQLELLKTDKVEQVDFSHCSLSLNSSSNFTATLLINDVPIRKIEDNSSNGSGLENFSGVIKQGTNVFTLKVASINKKEESNYLDLYLDCDLRPSMDKIDFLDEHKSLDFGDFFKSAYLPLAEFKFVEKGEYSESFDIEF